MKAEKCLQHTVVHLSELFFNTNDRGGCSKGSFSQIDALTRVLLTIEVVLAAESAKMLEPKIVQLKEELAALGTKGSSKLLSEETK